MKLIQPIKDTKLIDTLKSELLKVGYKNYLLFDIAINTGLKIIDIINLTVWDVKNKSQIEVKEVKTGKRLKYAVSPEINKEIQEFILGMSPGQLLFPNKKGGKNPITNKYAHNCLNEISEKLGLDNIGTHTLRKTFGYHHYIKHNDITLLQNLFNHSTPDMTLRYIGITDIEAINIEDFFQ
ncbi:tyrosine-type recombinase/integrase [Clostridium sp. YIM B02505]|uniref:Tyrosine-type recombinase/integrase n=1 Tax=Clostridium yunnanense TaxID=2800325 RepID=A0ABS1ETS0_9CLOT|nr:tyrosine-type recombinase/integrase [Clostridium yunnanense]MBK1812729.1 tyrosine-type recombinase/integrase [Clostridium yunnanense]